MYYITNVKCIEILLKKYQKIYIKLNKTIFPSNFHGFLLYQVFQMIKKFFETIYWYQKASDTSRVKFWSRLSQSLDPSQSAPAATESRLS